MRLRSILANADSVEALVSGMPRLCRRRVNKVVSGETTWTPTRRKKPRKPKALLTFLCFNSKGIKFYTTGENAYVYVRDVSRAMIELMESNITSERFILSAENVSYKQLFNLMAHNLGKAEPSIAVKPWMIELSWRLIKISSFFTGKQPSLTKDTARSSMKISRYSSNKIKESLGFKFTSLEEMIKLTAKQFLHEQA